jgi:hypothetical protein
MFFKYEDPMLVAAMLDVICETESSSHEFLYVKMNGESVCSVTVDMASST